MIKILITGDFCPNYRVVDLIKKGEYKQIFNDFIPFVKNVDIAITNLECPLLENGKKIHKAGPNLKATEKSIEAITYAGFDIVTLANNHIMDYGSEGLISTVKLCKKSCLDYVGVGSSLDEARIPLYKNINGKLIAILNFTENEFSTTTGNEIGANPINLIYNYQDIKKAKSKADYVFVIVHGGHEMYSFPSPTMQETYRFFVDSGADVVVGHHTHCYSGYEIYHGSPILYSLGNFSFDWKGKTKSIWNEGFAVILTIIDNSVDLEMVPYIQGNEIPGIRLMNCKEKQRFKSDIERINKIIKEKELLSNEFKKFCKSVSEYYLLGLEPYSNKYLKALRFLRIIPSFISKKKKNWLYDLISCEAQRELILSILKESTKNKYD